MSVEATRMITSNTPGVSRVIILVITATGRGTREQALQAADLSRVAD